MAQLVLPRVQAMVLCDDVVESDDEAEVADLVSVRAVIESPVFPTVQAQLCVFLQMSGHGGQAKCHIEIESLATGDVIGESEPMTISFIDPTDVVPVHFRLPNCVFPAPAVYYVQVLAEDKVIGERPLLLRKVE